MVTYLIAVTEAVNNAIYHGNKGNPDKHIKIGFESARKKYLFFGS
jgi:anti-sigma regulatory factor (Ser/Thr protein kinase)